MSFMKPKVPEPVPAATPAQSPTLMGSQSPLTTSFNINRPINPFVFNPKQPGRRSLIGGSQ